MANLKLDLSTLGEVDTGAARAIIDRAIEEAIHDIEDRGEDGRARKVAIELMLERREDGHIEAHVSAQSKLPPRRTAGTVCRPVQKPDGVSLFFQQWAPDNPAQETLPVMDETKDK